MDRQGPPNWPRYQLTRGLTRTRHEKDAMTSRCLGSKEVRCSTWRMHSPDGSCRYYIQDVFFWRLAGPVVSTGKAIVHWIGY